MAVSIDLSGLPLAGGKLSAAAILILGVLVYHLFIKPTYVSKIRNVPGPSTRNLISGNLAQIFEAEAASLHTGWVEQFGKVVKYRGFMGESRLYVTDPKALQHILLNHSYEYPKPAQAREQMGTILGKGILFAEGDDHKRQKRNMTAAFTWTQVNGYLPIFQAEANRLRDRLDEVIEQSHKEGSSAVKGDHVVIDFVGWLSRCTLDIIGLAGFDFAFNELDTTAEETPLASVFRGMLKPRKITTPMILMFGLARYFPIVTKLPTKTLLAVKKSMAVMQGEGRKMLEIRRKQAEAGELDDKIDLLSLIVKANLKESKKDMITDEELMGQITTFMLAGHETTAVALSWTLLYLSKNKDMQDRLRKEVQEAKGLAKSEGRDELSAEELNSLPYMDAVIRETMRFCPPVHLTVREAGHDDVIPLSEPLVGKNGKQIDAVTVSKGTVIVIGIYTMQQSKELFGEDAGQYRPDRWLEADLESRAKGFTAWAPLLAFLGGPRGCIGYRFALLEYKTILATLINAYEFEERDIGGTEFTKRSNIVTRMCLAGKEDEGSQLPLRVKKAVRV